MLLVGTLTTAKENQNQVQTFLNSENEKDFKLIEDKKILSHNWF